MGLINAGLLVLVMMVFARLQFGVGLESIVAGAAQDRLMGVANRFRLELDSSTDKDGVIAEYARLYDAKVFLTNPQGEALYGPAARLPAAVLAEMRSGPPGRGRRPPPKKGGPPPEDEDPRAKGPGGRPPPRGEPLSVVRTTDPAAYWALLRIPIVTPDREPRPAMLIFRSASIFNSRLFFDWKPWAALATALLGVSLFCWIPFLRKLTGSIREMDLVTREIALGRFDARAPESRRDELGDLGRQINSMAAQLDSFVSSQKRFLGDVAHELSAPLARIQFALGILERRVEQERRADIDVLRDEIQEMSVLVNELLSFSKVSLGPGGAGALEPVKVGEVLRAAASRESVAAEIRVDGELAAMARHGQLLRAVGNLLRNAQRYAGEHGPIEVEARREGKDVVIVVADHGPGLPEAALEQVFEPFWRPQSSRSRDTGGVGLGLSIVKSCVESCGGTVRCRNRQPSGLAVTIRLAAAGGSAVS